MLKLWHKITFLWAYWFSRRYISVDYGSYDDEACVVWFKHNGKVYITDYTTRNKVIEDETP